jgi:hypothetical protein
MGLEMKSVLLAFAMAAVTACAQDSTSMAVEQANQLTMDAGMQAAQQAQQDMMAAAQANQQAMQQMQLTNQITFLGIQQANLQTGRYVLTIPPWNSWRVDETSHLGFSVKPGLVKPGTEVRIKWRGTDYSAVYYTIDGWTPTLHSTIYNGPITINSATHIQAVGVGWNFTRSKIIDAYYDVPPGTTAARPTSLIADGLLRAGSVLRLATAAEVNSKTARTGDRIPLVLDQDVKLGTTVIIPRGTQVDAVLTDAAPLGGHNTSGILVFAVRSLKVNGTSILLHGGETLEGAPGREPMEAVIEPGMIVHATVAADAPLRP